MSENKGRKVRHLPRTKLKKEKENPKKGCRGDLRHF